MIKKNNDGTYTFIGEIEEENKENLKQICDDVGISYTIVEGKTIYHDAEGNVIDEGDYNEDLNAEDYISTFETEDANKSTIDHYGDHKEHDMGASKVENLPTIKLELSDEIIEQINKFNEEINYPLSEEDINEIKDILPDMEDKVFSTTKELYGIIQEMYENGSISVETMSGYTDSILKYLDMDGFINAEGNPFLESLDGIAGKTSGMIGIAMAICAFVEIDFPPAVIVAGAIAGGIDLIIDDASNLELVKNGEEGFFLSYTSEAGNHFMSKTIKIDYTKIEETIYEVLEYIKVAYGNLNFELKRLEMQRKSKIETAKNNLNNFYINSYTDEDYQKALTGTYNCIEWFYGGSIEHQYPDDSLYLLEGNMTIYTYYLMMDEDTHLIKPVLEIRATYSRGTVTTSYVSGQIKYLIGEYTEANRPSDEYTFCQSAFINLRNSYYKYYVDNYEMTMTYNLYDFANEKNVKLSGSSWLDSTPDVIFGDIKTLEQSSYYDSELLEDLLELLENVKSKHENLVNYYKDGSKTIEEKEQEITDYLDSMQ